MANKLLANAVLECAGNTLTRDYAKHGSERWKIEVVQIESFRRGAGGRTHAPGGVSCLVPKTLLTWGGGF